MNNENDLRMRLDRVEGKLDALEGKLDALASSVERRFVDVEHRFAGVDERFADIDARFDYVDRRFEDIEGHFAAIGDALVEQRRYTEFAFGRLSSELKSEMKAGFSNVDSRLNQLDRRLEQFIDTQSTANQLVERRLQQLERGTL